MSGRGKCPAFVCTKQNQKHTIQPSVTYTLNTHKLSHCVSQSVINVIWSSSSLQKRPVNGITTTPCLKKRPTFGLLQVWCRWMDFDIFGRNVTDKVGNQKTLYYGTSDNFCFCTTCQNGETWKSQFSLNWTVLHTQYTCSLSSWKKNCHLWCVW